MILGFTGTQAGMTDRQYSDFAKFLLDTPKIKHFHHGMCIGADEQAEELMRLHRADVVIFGHPPKNRSKISRKSNPDIIFPPAEYLTRNKKIVDASNFLIATPRTSFEILRSGTWSTIRYAMKKEVPRWVILP